MRLLCRLATCPPLSAVLLAWAVFLGELAQGRMGMMGVHDEELANKILGSYGNLFVIEQLRIALVYGAAAALSSLIIWGALTLWNRARQRTSSRARQTFGVLLILALVHAWRFALSIIHHPQLYTDVLYDHAGWRRTLQTTLTDHVPRALVEWLGWLALAGFILGPLATPRGRGWVRFFAARAKAFFLASRTRQTLLMAIAACLLGGVVFLDAYRHLRTPPVPPQPPNILLLAVDSLRADRVGPGHETVTPYLSSLAARSVQFSSAYVTVPRTFPSWITLLSGRWPARHGIRTMFPSGNERAAIGPALPAHLAAHGYATTVVSDFAGEIFSRVDVGFAHRLTPYFGLRTTIDQTGYALHPNLLPYVAGAWSTKVAPSFQAAAENADPDRLATQIIETLEQNTAAQPFFLTAFFSAPHFPYAAPDPYYRRFRQPNYQGRFPYHKPPPWQETSRASLSEAEIAQVRHLYDGTVAATDAAIGRILDWMTRRGLERRTIIVILADHGENLYEDGRGMGHGEHLYGDGALHIPLIVFDPVSAFPAHSVAGIVRDVDLAPTLARLAGYPLNDVDGTDLGPLLRGEKNDLDLTAYAETGLWFMPEGPGFSAAERLPYPAVPASLVVEGDDDLVLDPKLRELVVVAKHRALRTKQWKLYYRPTQRGATWELFDLTSDPLEHKNVASQHLELTRELKAKLLAWMTVGGGHIDADFFLPP